MRHALPVTATAASIRMGRSVPGPLAAFIAIDRNTERAQRVEHYTRVVSVQQIMDARLAFGVSGPLRSVMET